MTQVLVNESATFYRLHWSRAYKQHLWIDFVILKDMNDSEGRLLYRAQCPFLYFELNALNGSAKVGKHYFPSDSYRIYSGRVSGRLSLNFHWPVPEKVKYPSFGWFFKPPQLVFSYHGHIIMICASPNSGWLNMRLKLEARLLFPNYGENQHAPIEGTHYTILWKHQFEKSSMLCGHWGVSFFSIKTHLLNSLNMVPAPHYHSLSSDNEKRDLFSDALSINIGSDILIFSFFSVILSFYSFYNKRLYYPALLFFLISIVAAIIINFTLKSKRE